VNHLKVRSCLIDGEGLCCDEKGVTAWRSSMSSFLELNGAELRREPIEVRKATLASILRKARHGVRLNEHLEHPEGGRVPARLQDGSGEDYLKAVGLALSIWWIARLAQAQES
jgi:hypothetical protein